MRAARRGRLQELGIFRESGHEHFNGSLVVPVLSLEGEVLGIYGRKITPNLREGTPDHLYIKGEHRGVWNEEALVASKEIILCESLIDAMTFWVAGFRNVTASYGVHGFTKDHKAAFAKHGVERVYLAYDADDAGNGAAAKLAAELMEGGVECFRVQFPKGMGANEYARKVQPAAKSLGVLLRRAEGRGRGARPSVAVAEVVAAAEEKQATKGETLDEEPEPERCAPLEQSAESVLPSAAVLPPSIAPQTSSQIDVPVELRGEDVLIRLGDREYRVRGLGKNTSADLLRVNLRVLSTNPEGDVALHVDTLELNASRQRMVFIKQAAEELGIRGKNPAPRCGPGAAEARRAAGCGDRQSPCPERTWVAADGK